MRLDSMDEEEEVTDYSEWTELDIKSKERVV